MSINNVRYDWLFYSPVSSWVVFVSDLFVHDGVCVDGAQEVHTFCVVPGDSDQVFMPVENRVVSLS